MSVTYQFYENKIWNKARVHVSDCSFCNYGQGIHKDATEENGWWSNEYSTLDEVIAAAYRTGRKVLKCKRCLNLDMEKLAV